ncbi:hypothetical protein C8R46DRAFT_935408 [Mycena filopes]|nr:hypothetical protein C8R46DRAFT_935408 [Mycena filopes]
MSAPETLPDSSPCPFTPRAPFDDTTTDVILHSWDGADFHVHRLVLSLASPFFKDMFALPQSNTEATASVATVQMSETSHVLDMALRVWYPGAEPPAAQTLDEFRAVFEALIMKFDMQFLVPSAKKQLREYLEEDPVAVFAIACRHEWNDLAREAARRSLRLPLRAFEAARPARLNYMSADIYHTLLHYHSECAKAAAWASSSLRWATYQDIPGAECPNWTDPALCPRAGHWSFAHSTMAPITAWLATYLASLTEVLLVCPAAQIDSPELLRPTMIKMGSCSSCAVDGYAALMDFLLILKAKIDGNIDAVKLTLDF